MGVTYVTASWALTHWWTVEPSTKGTNLLRNSFHWRLLSYSLGIGHKKWSKYISFWPVDFPRNTSILSATFRWHDFPSTQMCVNLTWIRTHQSLDHSLPTIFTRAMWISIVFFVSGVSRVCDEFTALVICAHYRTSKKRNGKTHSNRVYLISAMDTKRPKNSTEQMKRHLL